ncbi:PIR protein [Plasmodium yoelii]|uniref:PIR protein n=3 Tax=Plasmodium yoelii TaxID=5861 RepID=A0AAE9WXM5_PLAYO|nr:PIR protein [Plasmodium yoelii]XP_034493624.1 PIR protein [Plasmodium yoelii]EAA16700.1 cir1 protein, putative [Plasmodium yoelii yoelii]WBY58313.1 PIR protein [Plasmodium yoelii yoelii]WBY60517.1 PIR protein [Plasmodium yoelii yoelii]VTZ79230.1 PIR protein [Plasmodium yoelii]VTZ81294.1 PIR protein [Plasmodium yoelii]|eukprot:XP_022811152.2 PIR protein [Plasmodium yoelii]
MSYKVCDIISAIDNYVDDPKNSGGYNSISYFKYYCPDNKCDTDEKKIISAFIALIPLFNGMDDVENLESDKLAEYAILWLSYKLNQKTENGTTKLYDFYTKHIEKNSYYDKHITTDNGSNKINKAVIDKKIKSMNMNIKDISNFYDPFKSLCKMYIEVDASNQCMQCLENAGDFFEKCEKVKNTLDISKGSSYSQLWSSLSNDYDKFKEKYNSVKCGYVSSLVACPRSSVTKNTLIKIAIIFVASSILLGISYKYSLFGFRKKVKKRLRRKLKSLRRKWLIDI